MDTFHNAEEGVEGPYAGMVLTAPISLARFGPIVVSAHTDIGVLLCVGLQQCNRRSDGAGGQASNGA